MRSESPLFQIVSLLLMFGPIYLFWHIDWYWIVGYYNLFFTYSALTLYKSYNRDSNYRRKYHPIIYLGLPLILNFVGFLISLLNGFEEIRKDEKVKEKSLNKNISQESQKANKNVGDEYEFLPIDSFDNEDIELLKTLYQLYKDLDFEKYQTNAYDLWKKYLDKRINEFYSLKEGEEIIIKKLSKGVGDDEEEYFLELVYEGSQVTNGYDSDNEKFEHGFYCNILKLEYRFGGDSDIICFFPPFATFNKSDENFFLVNYPKKYNSFEFVNAVSNIESEQGKIEDICRSLSKFHFVEFNRFSKQEDGRIHTNRIIELEEAEKDDNSDFKADKKESKEQELKESEVSFDTDQEWEIEKDYLKNPSFKFRKIENGNIVSIN